MTTGVLWVGARVLAHHILIASTFPARARGLLGRAPLPAGSMMLITPCNAVHTCFMRYPLDLVFVDAGWRICCVTRSVKPFRMAWGGRGAHAVLEATSGWLTVEGLRPGTALRLEPGPG
jgi:uncharacterized membrane protein (UPF0127 family)